MIYACPSPDDRIDQGDILDGCPILNVVGFNAGEIDTGSIEVEGAFCRVLVLTQACDLANRKTSMATVAVVR
ncbi:MAG: hypothetical protein U1E05_26140 [Patescibacteria group bacterium]|nr:hypothetical protein [Patescibacteria group bacterium]